MNSDSVPEADAQAKQAREQPAGQPQGMGPKEDPTPMFAVYNRQGRKVTDLEVVETRPGYWAIKKPYAVKPGEFVIASFPVAQSSLVRVPDTFLGGRSEWKPGVLLP